MARPSKSVEAYMPLFIGPYLADTMHLTRDQHGGYLLLLMAYWREGGALPDDDTFLAGVTRCSPPEWRKLRPVLARFFEVCDGKWTQKRADAEIARALELKTKRTQAAAAASNARYGKTPKASGTECVTVSVTECETDTVTDTVTDAISPLTLSSNEDSIPREQIDAAVEAYNAAAKKAGWAACQQITSKRRAGIAARIREAGGLDVWRAAMTRAAASAFLRGETGRGPGHESWRPNLDFFLRPDSFAKLTEGAYDGRQAIATRPSGPLHAMDRRKRADAWARGHWPDAWGPKPGEPGCCLTDDDLARAA